MGTLLKCLSFPILKTARRRHAAPCKVGYRSQFPRISHATATPPFPRVRSFPATIQRCLHARGHGQFKDVPGADHRAMGRGPSQRCVRAGGKAQDLENVANCPPPPFFECWHFSSRLLKATPARVGAHEQVYKRRPSVWAHRVPMTTRPTLWTKRSSCRPSAAYASATSGRAEYKRQFWQMQYPHAVPQRDFLRSWRDVRAGRPFLRMPTATATRELNLVSCSSTATKGRADPLPKPSVDPHGTRAIPPC